MFDSSLRSRRPLAPLFTLICGLGAIPAGCADPDDDSVHVSDPGVGEPSEAPLAGRRMGTRRTFWAGSGDERTTAVLGPADRWGGSVQRFVESRTGEVRFFREAESGLLYVGTVRLGELREPILLVPAAVRDQMTWEVRGVVDDLLGTFRAERLAGPSLFGALPVWRITQSNAVTGNVFTTDYVEGYGEIATESARLAHAIIPHDPPAAAPAPRVGVTPLGGSSELDGNFEALSASLIVWPSGARTLRIGGRYAYYSNVGGGPSGAYVLGPSVLCVALGDDGVGEVTRHDRGSATDTDYPCADAQGAVFDPSGQLHALDYAAGGSPAGESLQPETRMVPLVGEDGAIVAMMRHVDNFALEALYDVVELDRARAPVAVAASPVDAPWQAVPRPTEVGHVTPSHALAGTTLTGGALGYGLLLGDRLFSGRVADGAFGPLRLIASFPGGQLSARLDMSGRDYTMATRDGVVDRLRVGVDGVRVARLAALDLPAGHELVSAVPLDDARLIVVTVAERGDTVAPELIGQVHLFTAPIPGDEFGPPEAASPAHNILTFPHDHDLRVCWPGETGVGGAWTLGGEPARAELVDGADDGMSCVILLRARPGTLERPDAWLAQGAIPGVGAVTLARDAAMVVPSRGPFEGAGKLIGALRGGGFVSAAYLYGEDGVAVAAAPWSQGRAGNPVDDGIADAGGFGVWLKNRLPEGCPAAQPGCMSLRRVGRDVAEVFVPRGGIVGPVRGGGVLWQLDGAPGTAGQNADGGVLVGPDGAITELPRVEGVAATSYLGATSDGLACGLLTRSIGRHATAHDLFCRDPDGTVRTAPGDAAPNGRWLPGGGGFYHLASAAEVRHLDPATLTWREVDLAALALPAASTLRHAWSAGGELFVQVADPSTERTAAIFVLRDGAAVPVEIPEELRPTLPAPGRLLVGERLVVLFGAPTVRWAP